MIRHEKKTPKNLLILGFHPPSSYSFQHNLYSTPQPRSMAHRSLSTGSTHNQLPGFVNPYAVHSSSQSKVPVRPHNDYLKYGQGVNVQYNPYNSNFNPTLMARPNIEPFQSTAIQTSIANAIANRRTPTLYSSVIGLNLDAIQVKFSMLIYFRKNS